MSDPEKRSKKKESEKFARNMAAAYAREKARVRESLQEGVNAKLSGWVKSLPPSQQVVTWSYSVAEEIRWLDVWANSVVEKIRWGEGFPIEDGDGKKYSHAEYVRKMFEDAQLSEQIQETIKRRVEQAVRAVAEEMNKA